MSDWYCAVQGKRFGPISEADLGAWVRDGRVTAQDLVWAEGMSDWVPAGTVDTLKGLFAATPAAGAPPAPAQPMPPGAPGAPPALKAHRGGVILVLGILGLVTCCICGIIAWSMGNTDLREMDAGRMDPTGRGLTSAGRICGMISVILGIVATVFYGVFMFIGAASGGF